MAGLAAPTSWSMEILCGYAGGGATTQIAPSNLCARLAAQSACYILNVKSNCAGLCARLRARAMHSSRCFPRIKSLISEVGTRGFGYTHAHDTHM